MKAGMREKLRGQPLTVLVLVIAGWAGVRTLTWQPLDVKLDLLLGRNSVLKVSQPPSETNLARGPRFAALSYLPPYGTAYPNFYPPPGWNPWVAYVAGPRPRYSAALSMQPAPVGLAMGPAYSGGYATSPSGFAPPLAESGYALPGGDVPRHAAQSIAEAPAPIPLSPGLAEGKVDRWSADAWMLLRKEGRASFSGGQPIYGGSQAGAVLRYRLAPNSGHRPLAYLRTSQALGRIPESELALGLGARPVASIPIMLAAEARAFRSGRKTQFRPAALAYTELPPFRMPFGLTGEAYLQGGYVAGDFKTGFIDGQLRVDRRFLTLGGRDIRLGGGIWGGAQKGAKRLDIGPGASADLVLMGRPSRVSVDWRFRVLGDAEPGSGPAMTLSTGF